MIVTFPGHTHLYTLPMWLYALAILFNQFTVKPVLSGHSKIDKTKILMTNGSLMKVGKTMLCLFESGCFTQILLYIFFQGVVM